MISAEAAGAASEEERLRARPSPEMATRAAVETRGTRRGGAYVNTSVERNYAAAGPIDGVTRRARISER